MTSVTPALAIRQSIGAAASNARRNARIASESRTSIVAARTEAPLRSQSAATSARRASSRPISASATPRAAYSSARARPRPLLAPRDRDVCASCESPRSRDCDGQSVAALLIETA